MAKIIIIGGGVTGSAIARSLSKYDYEITVLEKESDICEGTSKANSGIVHAGFDAHPGSLKAKLNVLGNKIMPELAKELDIPFKQNGSLVLCFDEKDRPKLEQLVAQGVENGVEGVRIVEQEELRKLEPQISENAVAALYAPTGGIVCPFNLTIALAENAAVNGVNFQLGTKVESVAKTGDGFEVTTNKGVLTCDILINAAGVYADVFHNALCKDKIKIIARKGEYCLMDKAVGNLVHSTIFQLPTIYGKGVLVTPTVHGNLLTGPTAVDIENPEGVNTTAEGMDDLLKRAALSVKALPTRQIITSFAGIRAHEENGDFIIGEAEDVPGFFDASGIESPGLTCAPALGEYLAETILAKYPAKEKENFVATRKGIPSMALATPEEKQQLIAKNPLYANVVCRCELVTEGEIMDAIHRPLGATTLDGVKRRTRAGMGRCQAGFCSPKTVEILARELNKDLSEIHKNGDDSAFLTGFNKDGI